MAAWFLQCFRGMLGKDDEEDEMEEGSNTEHGWQSRWETETEREQKQRLKKYKLEELRRELELLGVCIDEQVDQSRHRSQRRKRREYRKLLVREMRNIVVEKLRQTEEERLVLERLNTARRRLAAMNDRGTLEEIKEGKYGGPDFI